jgi:tetratricopeptide (TPR) repeat protein
VGVDRFRVCELFAAGPDVEGSGSAYRLGDRLVLTARHVVAPSLAGPGGQVLVRPVGEPEWLPARVEWQDVDADAALLGIDDEGWRPLGGESVLRWGELAGSDPVPCAAVGFPWASARPDRLRDTAHVYGQLAPLGQLRAGWLDVDVASASPSARAGGSPWAGMSGAGVIADSHLVGVITVDPARYQDRLVAVPVSRLLADAGFREHLAAYGVPTGAARVGGGWYLRLAGERTVSLDPPYRPVSRRFHPAPSTLLHAEHGLVPFLGRERLLDQVIRWCQDPASRPVLLVTGGGGSGKTRLGREACMRMLLAGWDAGLADDQRRDGTATTRLERATLVVVDDADLSTGLIAGLVGYLRGDDAGPEVRLLLLARARGVWWDQLVRQQELDGNYTVLDLDRYPVPPANRAEHFRRASAAFATYASPDTQSAEPPSAAELADPAFAEPLLIHIAALLRTMDTPAVPRLGPDGEAAPASGVTTGEEDQPARQRLLRALCERERARWYHHGDQLPFNRDLPLADQVVALATLTAAPDLSSATSLLAAVPNQAEVTRVEAEALAVWAHKLYAGPGYWNPLHPDLLAEQHLADTPQLGALATAATRLAAGQDWETGMLTQLLAELTRGAANQAAVQTALDELLGAALPQIVELAVTADSAELADLASLALQLAPQPGVAARLAGQMPKYSVRLAALAATLASQRVTQHRSDMDGRPDTTSRLAVSLNDQSVRLGDLGRREEALAAIEEAVVIYRELAAARLDAFDPSLAMSLDNLSNSLANLGRREDALAAGQEAVAIYRVLAAASPDAYGPDLAGSLNNLSNRLGNLGRREEALAAIEEAVAIRRVLAAASPDAYGPDLAMSLDNLSNSLANLGRREDALAAGQEAVAIRRVLAAVSADVYGPDLAHSLSNLSVSLADLGRPEEALAASEEATEIYRELAAASPDAFGNDMAGSLINLSSSLADLGRLEEALAAGEEATEIYRELAAARPDSFGNDLATSLNNLSGWLIALGRPEEALAAIEEAVTIRRVLVAARPDAFGPDLAGSLNNLSTMLSVLGRQEEALAANEEAVATYRELVAARPDAFGPDLALSLDNLSASLVVLGRLEEALAASEEAVATYRVLVAARPDAFGPDLALSLTNLSSSLVALGRPEEALAAIGEAVTIRRDVAGRRPAAAIELIQALTLRALYQDSFGNTAFAAESSAEAVSLCRRLNDGPGVTVLLASTLRLRGVFLLGLGRLAEALAPLQESAGHFQDLIATPVYLAVEHLETELKLGMCLTGLDRSAEATKHFHAALGLLRPLAASDPEQQPALAQTIMTLSEQLINFGQEHDVYPNAPVLTEILECNADLLRRFGYHDAAESVTEHARHWPGTPS